MSSENVLRGISIKALQKNPAHLSTCQIIDEGFDLNETRHITCGSGVKGSVVTITLPGNVLGVLSLCEVQVYGTYGKLSLICLLLISTGID